MIGFGFARNLGLCEPLHLSGCPVLPKDAPTRDNGAAATLPSQDFSGLGDASVPKSATPSIDLMAATAGRRAQHRHPQDRPRREAGVQEMDDGSLVMNLHLAQQLVYGRGEAKVTGIVLQLHRTEDLDAARARLIALFKANHLTWRFATIRRSQLPRPDPGFLQSMFSFIAVLIGVVVLFTVSTPWA